MTYISPIQNYLSKTLHGALMEAYGQLHDIPITELLDPENPAAIVADTVLKNTLGVNYDELAFYALSAVCELLTNTEVADAHVNGVANTLWASLGNPETGGYDPPKIYKDTAYTIYIMFVVILNPTFKPSKSD